MFYRFQLSVWFNIVEYIINLITISSHRRLLCFISRIQQSIEFILYISIKFIRIHSTVSLSICFESIKYPIPINNNTSQNI